MIIFKIAFSLLIVGVFGFIKENDTRSDTHIVMQYSGEGSKPNPIIFLYLKNARDLLPDNFITDKYEISKLEFDTIKYNILNSKISSIDTILKSSYEVVFTEGGETTVFSTAYLSRYRQIIELVLHLLEKSPKIHERVKKRSETFISRLGYENQLFYQPATN